MEDSAVLFTADKSGVPPLLGKESVPVPTGMVRARFALRSWQYGEEGRAGNLYSSGSISSSTFSSPSPNSGG